MQTHTHTAVTEAAAAASKQTRSIAATHPIDLYSRPGLVVYYLNLTQTHIVYIILRHHSPMPVLRGCVLHIMRNLSRTIIMRGRLVAARGSGGVNAEGSLCTARRLRRRHFTRYPWQQRQSVLDREIFLLYDILLFTQSVAVVVVADNPVPGRTTQPGTNDEAHEHYSRPTACVDVDVSDWPFWPPTAAQQATQAQKQRARFRSIIFAHQSAPRSRLTSTARREL